MTSEMTRASFVYTNNIIIVEANISGLKNTYIYLIALSYTLLSFLQQSDFPLGVYTPFMLSDNHCILSSPFNLHLAKQQLFVSHKSHLPTEVKRNM